MADSIGATMSGNGRPDLPIRSASLDNLRPKSSLRKKLNFIDDTSSKASGSGIVGKGLSRSAGEEGLRDLNYIINNKLRIVDSVLNGQRVKRKTSGGRDQGSFKARSGFEGNINTVAFDDDEEGDDDDNEDENEGDRVYEGNDERLSFGECEENENGELRLNENVNGDEDDEDFANVDEIDGPILGNAKDKTENKMKDIDYNLPVDVEFQKSLDQRAAEIESSSGFKPISKPKVEWTLNDFDSLSEDLPEWFCASDYGYFPQTKDCFERNIEDQNAFRTNDDYALQAISKIVNKISNNDPSGLLALTYVSMGNYACSDSFTAHIESIKRNNILLCTTLPELIKAFKDVAIGCRDDSENLKLKMTLLFCSSTVLFFIVNVGIALREDKPNTVQRAIEALDEAELLQFLTRYIEHWRWSSRLSMRIRNMINLLYKLLVLQFGDKNLHRRTKKQICQMHDIKRPIGAGSKSCTISPLYYQAFREDITARFPNYITPSAGLPTDVDNSNSLSQFLEIPRSKVRNPINLSLAVPNQNLATPAPSPPSSPSILHMGQSLKPKKSFQTNMAYPCLYPSDDEDGDDDFNERFGPEQTKQAVKVPYSIQEASKLLSENVEIKLSVKQLWHERKLFMMTERGWQVDHSKDPYNYAQIVNAEGDQAIDIMKRVDNYYENCFSSFNSLVFVLLQTIESNLTNADFRASELSEKGDMKTLAPHLEITRAKELSMKSSAGIIYLLLKWFKLNHVLKFEHFAVLLNDSRYVHICTTVLSKYADYYADKVYNKMLASNYCLWQHCSTYNSEYQQSYFIAPSEFNKVMLTSFAYMLKNLKKTIGTKTERLKELPLSVGLLFKKFYRVYNLEIYHPMLRIIKELTPFKNKRWKSEHMELISGVFLHERLELIDNWVTGKDVSGELSDACGQEIALRALLQFYNFLHYEKAMEDLGYSERINSDQPLLNKEAEYLGM